MILTILLFLLLLTIVIGVHEFGHLIAAKFFGVYCYEYSFGMGPLLWKKQTKETQYSLRAIPIGGYVSMAGEADDDSHPEIEVPKDRLLKSKPTWQRVIIMLAGVEMNFLLCFVILSVCGGITGRMLHETNHVTITVSENSAAETSGLKTGDVIKSLSGVGYTLESPKNSSEIGQFTKDHSGEEIVFEVIRDGNVVTVPVKPDFNEETKKYTYGIYMSNFENVPVNFLTCWKYGILEMGTIAKMTVEALRDALVNRNIDQVSGPVGVYTATKEAASRGIMEYLLLMAQMSLSVGIFNLIPLPILDGGQVLITIIEGAAGREMNKRLKIGLFGACWAALIMLMVLITAHDLTIIS